MVDKVLNPRQLQNSKSKVVKNDKFDDILLLNVIHVTHQPFPRYKTFGKQNNYLCIKTSISWFIVYEYSFISFAAKDSIIVYCWKRLEWVPEIGDCQFYSKYSKVTKNTLIDNKHICKHVSKASEFFCKTMNKSCPNYLLIAEKNTGKHSHRNYPFKQFLSAFAWLIFSFYENIICHTYIYL